MITGKLFMSTVTTACGIMAISVWWNLDDGGSRAFTALLAGFLLSRGISQLVFIWNTRHDTDNADR